MILQTSRLTLRALMVDDVDAMHGLMSDPEVMEYWDIGEIDDPELTRRILLSQIEAMARSTAIYWAMIRGEDGAFIGSCDLSDLDLWHKRAEIGFICAKPYWGEGYALEALQAVIDHAAQGLRLKRLSARTHFGNVRSARLLERLGFEHEGVLRGHVERGGQRRDCEVFGLLL